MLVFENIRPLGLNRDEFERWLRQNRPDYDIEAILKLFDAAIDQFPELAVFGRDRND